MLETSPPFFKISRISVEERGSGSVRMTRAPENSSAFFKRASSSPSFRAKAARSASFKISCHRYHWSKVSSISAPISSVNRSSGNSAWSFSSVSTV